MQKQLLHLQVRLKLLDNSSSAPSGSLHHLSTRNVSVPHPQMQYRSSGSSKAVPLFSMFICHVAQSQTQSLLQMPEVPGGTKPLRSWEKWYWGVGVVGISGLLYWNLKKPEQTPEEIAVSSSLAPCCCSGVCGSNYCGDQTWSAYHDTGNTAYKFACSPTCLLSQ